MHRKILEISRAHPGAVLFILLYLIIGGMYSVINPMHESTDELRHYRYVRYLADYGQLPVQSGDQGNAQAHHPPLYYATAAALSFWMHPVDPLYEPAPNPHWSFRNWEIGVDNKNQYIHGPDEAFPYQDNALAAHLARWVTILWGAGAVGLTYAIAYTLLPERPALHLLSAALIGLNPMFLYLGASVNNDVPAGLVGAAITLVCLQMIQQSYTQRRAIVLGVLYGIGLLVKFNLLAMLAVIEVALFLELVWEKEGRDWKTFLTANGIGAGVSLLISGWWYVRNTILYGEPTGFLRLTEIWGARDPREGVSLAWQELGYAWTSLWGRFGYGQIPMPTIFYTLIALVCGLGVIGMLIILVKQLRSKESAQSKMLIILLVSTLINFAVLYSYIAVSPAGAMGRFVFPGLSAFVVLVAYGLTGWTPRLPARITAGIITIGMLAFALIALFGYIAPAYAIPEQAASPDNPDLIQFDDYARILDSTITPSQLGRGDQLDVTVTWDVIQPTPEPYHVFIHLMTPQGAMIAQRDTYTGLGNYPSNLWQPGHIFTETYRVFLPETIIAPEQAILYIGLANPTQGRLSPDHPDSADLAAPLSELFLSQDLSGPYPNPISIIWEDRFELVGYTIKNRVQQPGDRVRFVFYWRLLSPSTDLNFEVFLHMRDGWENLASADGPPGVIPITDWEVGEVYKEERKFRVPEDTLPGFYLIELGWFSKSDGTKLNIIADDGHIVDNWLLLNTIRVMPKEPAQDE